MPPIGEIKRDKKRVKFIKLLQWQIKELTQNQPDTRSQNGLAEARGK